ncbi:hypothetical protein D3C84_945760 [compost metagenome]
MPFFITEGEGFRHGQRFGDAGGLDQQVIKTTIPGKFADFFEQVFAQGAADAAVAHFHEFFFGAVQGDITLNFAAIDVDFAHVVDDHGDSQVVAVTQHVVEQRAFAGAEKARQNGHGETIGHQVVLTGDARSQCRA